MVIFDRRFPSKLNIWYAFVACIFPIHVWSIINLFYEIPAWIIKENIWGLTGLIAYVLVFALFESILTLTLLVIASLILPARLFRENFVAISAAIVFLTSLWFIAAHFNDDIIRDWGLREFAPFFLLYLLSLGLAILVIYRFRKAGDIIFKLVQRLSVLSSVYIFIDLISVFIILVRNL